MELAAVTLVALCLAISAVSAERQAYELLTRLSLLTHYTLPDLPFAYDELEPYLDEHTLRVHHLGHHKAYTDDLNSALREWEEEYPFPASKWGHSSLVVLFGSLNSLHIYNPWITAIRNNGGGYANHIFYFNSMCSAQNRTDNPPTGKLAKDIDKTFGSFAEFKRVFTLEGSSLFGSGYVWLVEARDGTLSITTTHDQACPLSDNLYPLLAMDVWEHAYYLKHQNKRSEYISDWWRVVCWEQVDELRHFWWEFTGKGDFKHSEL